MSLLHTLKSLVNQRLSAAAEEIFWIVGRILTEYEDEAFHIKQENDRQRRLLDMILKPNIKLHRADVLLLPVCKEEVSPEQQERSPSLVQEEPDAPQIKEEQQDRSPSLVQEEPEAQQIKEELEELLQGQEEAGESTETLIGLKSEDRDDNMETEPIASTSTEHMNTQADVEDSGTSHPTKGDQLLSSHCSESDTEDSDEWEIREDQSALNTLKTQHVGVNILSLKNKPPQDLKSSKQSHSMRSHIEKKTFSCTDCGKMFLERGHLKRHTVIHTGEKPFTCTVCGKGCSQRGELKTHMMTHTGERPFGCTVCGKGHVRMVQLKLHMMTHTGEKPFTCTVCGKGCSQKGKLKTHMMTHTGEKPFGCTVCGKGHIQKVNLKLHMMTHTGEKPFTCTVCGKGFSQNGRLKAHTVTHTEENNP